MKHLRGYNNVYPTDVQRFMMVINHIFGSLDSVIVVFEIGYMDFDTGRVKKRATARKRSNANVADDDKSRIFW